MSNDPKCEDCDNPATCVGRYDGRGRTGFGCDECCGHGNEDGWCYLIDVGGRATHHAERDVEWQRRLASLHEGFNGDACDDNGDPIEWSIAAIKLKHANQIDELRDLVADAAPYLAWSRRKAQAGSNLDKECEGWLKRAFAAVGDMLTDDDTETLDDEKGPER